MDTEPRATAKQITQHLNLVVNTIYFWRDRKDFPANKIGRLWKFQPSKIDVWDGSTTIQIMLCGKSNKRKQI